MAVMVPGQRDLRARGQRAQGVGTRNHCMNGKDAIIEEVLDWRPFDYFTVSVQLPIPSAPKIVMTARR